MGNQHNQKLFSIIIIIIRIHSIDVFGLHYKTYQSLVDHSHYLTHTDLHNG